MSSSILANMSAWDDSSNTQSSSSSGPASRLPAKPRPAKQPVKDDWEDDDDEEEDDEPPSAERNRQIWEDANNKVHHPMPDLILSRNSSLASSSSTAQGIFQQQPTMRILKRPTANSNNSPSPAPSDKSAEQSTMEQLKEREARYQAARERIFGSGGETAETARASPKPQQTQVKIAREPHGPSSGSGSSGQAPASKGFVNRRGKPPSPGV
ncbi:hypothetical protein CC1G_06969 [Coprinopsis cinerea okayama7|uniref:SUZ domain-containing protein n=1 Tax=Coprinopsis cinerea (strain Okayama-7 / 130 / ATCC MYA-4618 / FGSC 9003) TaxID=240176 RepID=A8NZW1_COPC7|nr:hypothetical protein CC1G_06969 [Coprinopsis cinerea okayama7\|eukprot:XP_001837763.1 hypothetical protein CC1G_06969 [Coprinopsis cinerea okayama7\